MISSIISILSKYRYCARNTYLETTFVIAGRFWVHFATWVTFLKRRNSSIWIKQEILKAKNGTCRKLHKWAELFHIDLQSKLYMLRKLLVKFSLSTLLILVLHLFNESTNRYTIRVWWTSFLVFHTSRGFNWNGFNRSRNYLAFWVDPNVENKDQSSKITSIIKGSIPDTKYF